MLVELPGTALSIRFRTRRAHGRAPAERFSGADVPWSRVRVVNRS
jgi:hypothetical protein